MQTIELNVTPFISKFDFKVFGGSFNYSYYLFFFFERGSHIVQAAVELTT